MSTHSALVPSPHELHLLGSSKRLSFLWMQDANKHGNGDVIRQVTEASKNSDSDAGLISAD